MNIKFDDGTKEDLIKNFDFASHMNDNLVVDFNGTLNGKNINLSYNMIDGKVYYQEYLYKDK
jgi:FKBP-type peptidyl-prolyl cis-trans isomerase 2